MLLTRAILPDEQASYWAPHVTPSAGATGIAAGIVSTARYYFELPVDFVGDVPYASGVYFATLPFLFAGIATNLRRDYHVVVYTCVTIVVYCLVWQGRAGLRFLFPLLPFYVHWVCAGLAWYAMALGGLAGKAAKVVSLCVLVVILTYWARTDVQQAVANMANNRETTYDAFAPATLKLYDFVRANVPEDAVIVFFKPRAMRLATGRQAVQSTNAQDLAPGGYLCIYVGRGAYGQIPRDMVDERVRGGELTSVYSNADFRLYRINRSHQ
jgi:hypothetical protein